jgi:HAD superfamily hydrolase (TIGR01509 family)
VTTSLGLPDGVRVCLFDLDGVLTDTAAVHTVALEGDLRRVPARPRPGQRAVRPREGLQRATSTGKPRADGVRSFLASRGIELPEGDPDDGPDVQTVHGLGRRKNDVLLETLERDGVEVFPASVRYLEAVRAAGLPTAVVSSSANTEQVLQVTGLTPLIDLRVDALVARAEGLAGKPAPDTFLFAAERLGASAAEAVVYEDALAGVQSGRAGGFAYVVGVDRAGQADALREAGADRVVQELDELLEDA